MPENVLSFGNRAVGETITHWLDGIFPEYAKQWSLGPSSDSKTADSPARIVARDQQELPRAMVFVAAKCSPGLVARGAKNADDARELLGAELGQSVQCALRSGFCAGLSIAVYPWRLECSKNIVLARIQRTQIRRWLLEWLRGVATVCTARYPESKDQAEVKKLLHALSTCSMLGCDIQLNIEQAMARLNHGSWRPRTVLDHNDLWLGNVMLNRDQRNKPAGPSPFVIIDWAGANHRGGGFVDLVRVMREFGVSERRLRHEVACHCRILGLELIDAISQLLVSLAQLYQNLDFFPVEKFAKLATESVRTLRVALDPIGP